MNSLGKLRLISYFKTYKSKLYQTISNYFKPNLNLKKLNTKF